ncbi:hypothetical protein J2S08_000221 [Bacillus chungangensis]|uniref:Uncharacterized protein n=1 Tax=Bacillus chungangensis TaxID=587633 RepID=A0ABT9WNM8_9BACI|nr:hypothetical protein [Bacillus chungangensis]
MFEKNGDKYGVYFEGNPLFETTIFVADVARVPDWSIDTRSIVDEATTRETVRYTLDPSII